MRFPFVRSVRIRNNPQQSDHDPGADATFIAAAPEAVDDLLAEVRRLQTENFAMHAALDAAREETAQAVREEREACALVAARYDDDGWWTIQRRIAERIRSRSHPGEKADA